MGSEVHPGNGHISKNSMNTKFQPTLFRFVYQFLIRPLNSNSMEEFHVHETVNWAGFKVGVKGVYFRVCFSTLPIFVTIKFCISARLRKF